MHSAEASVSSKLRAGNSAGGMLSVLQCYDRWTKDFWLRYHGTIQPVACFLILQTLLSCSCSRWGAAGFGTCEHVADVTPSSRAHRLDKVLLNT